jgi:hypothetical protein
VVQATFLLNPEGAVLRERTFFVLSSNYITQASEPSLNECAGKFWWAIEKKQ